ncbi:DUF4296 domain-containing protein [Bizionia sediminis]|uniref:DUF4296 domain-containing protein n=1 Tax=Bizionia sediminis TaxID=1737064 RepID=A0ABW5KRD4_9FLAO
MKNLVIYTAIVFFVVGCRESGKPEAPENLISEDKMVTVLMDLSILSAAKGINRTILENKGIAPEAFVYNKHQIDSAQFANSNQYYAYYNETYKAILARVADSLRAKKEVINKAFELENKRLEDQKSKEKAEEKFKEKANAVTDTLQNVTAANQTTAL